MGGKRIFVWFFQHRVQNLLGDGISHKIEITIITINIIFVFLVFRLQNFDIILLLSQITPHVL